MIKMIKRALHRNISQWVIEKRNKMFVASTFERHQCRWNTNWGGEIIVYFGTLNPDWIFEHAFLGKGHNEVGTGWSTGSVVIVDIEESEIWGGKAIQGFEYKNGNVIHTTIMHWHPIKRLVKINRRSSKRYIKDKSHCPLLEYIKIM